MNKKILKEVFIVLLLLIVAIFIIGILFYDFIPTGSESYASVVYVEDENVNKVIEDISKKSGVEEEKTIDSYKQGEEVTEQADSNLETGKKDPFSNYSSSTESNNEIENTTNENMVNSNTNQTVENTVKTNTTTPGTFFEKPNMK